jgi:hypothetical protein
MVEPPGTAELGDPNAGMTYIYERITYICVEGEQTTVDPTISTATELEIKMSNGRGIVVTPKDATSFNIRRTP